MMKKTLFILLFTVFYITQANAQKHDFLFYTKSGGIQVFVNDELHGEIGNGGRYNVKVKFSEEVPSYKLTLKKEGFEDKEYVFDSKPAPRSTKIFWAMQKKKFKLSETIDHTFELARVKYDIPPDEVVVTTPGSNTYWSSIGIEESKVEMYERSLHDELVYSGFNGLTNAEKEENLFGGPNTDTKEELADISIGAIIKDLKIGGTFNTFYPNRIYDLSIKLEIEWQFYDNVSEKFLIKVSTQEEAFMVKETGELIKGINLAFTENFAEALRNQEVIDAIMNVESGAEKTYKEDVMKQFSILKSEDVKYGSYNDMIKSVNPSVVTLKGSNGHGSGFVISKEGYILTNYHVIENNNNIKILFQMGFELPAEVLSYSEEFDLALLKVMGSGFKPLNVEMKPCELGDEVIAIGTPSSTDLSNSVTKGIVSGKRTLENGIEYIQTDVSVSPGNSGGPLINENGHVVGIVSQKLIGVGTEGIAFAIPIESALKKLNISLK